MQVESTILNNKPSYFDNFCTSVQNKTNTCIKSIEQNETARITTAAVAKYAPFVIGFLGGYFAPVTTAICLAATLVIASKKVKPQYVSKQVFGNVLMGVGASMGLKSLTLPFLKMIACALASGVTLFVGAAFSDLLPTEKMKKV